MLLCQSSPAVWSKMGVRRSWPDFFFFFFFSISLSKVRNVPWVIWKREHPLWPDGAGWPWGNHFNCSHLSFSLHEVGYGACVLKSCDWSPRQGAITWMFQVWGRGVELKCAASLINIVSENGWQASELSLPQSLPREQSPWLPPLILPEPALCWPFKYLNLPWSNTKTA